MRIFRLLFRICLPAILLAVCGGICAEKKQPLPWSFQKPERPDVPSADELKHGPARYRNPIDAFVLAGLEERSLDPAPEAERHVLVRRAYFDLLGLPPTVEQVTAFVENDAEDAWETLIDELLKSTHYGERWGRHWLDVARYADSGGYETDIYYRFAWRYRDYVVKSFNDDKPYNIFVQEQIAGDEIWPDNLDLDPKRVYQLSDEKRRHLEARIGTGFYTLGPLVHESGLDARRLRHEMLTDWIDTTGAAFLGLTIGCARCHDHKFDPLSQQDYYDLQAIFSGSRQVEIPLLTAMEVNDWRQFYPRVVAVNEARTAYKLFQARTGGRALTTEEEKEKQQLLVAIAEAVLQLPEKAGSVPNSPFDSLMGIPAAAVLDHQRRELVPTIFMLERGELSRPTSRATAALPATLAMATGVKREIDGPFGTRKQLALWLTRPDHPLTARVMVNRLWQWHFGRGIVATPSDFGAMGTGPTHPDLLDWLATEFVEHKWSIKQMHRLIMNSSTYRLASNFATPTHLEKDPANRYLWRMNRRRLEAEAIWDAVHSTAGTLNLQTGGRPVVPPLAEDEIAALRERWHWPVSADPAQHTRRGMYILVRRNFPFPMFEVFDAPVTSSSCPARDVTTVAPQALWTLNSPSVFEQAKQLAGRIATQAGTDPAEWTARAWMTVLSRPISGEEATEAASLFGQLQKQAMENQDRLAASLGELPESLRPLDLPQATAMIQFCLALYNLNEFAFID
ncbi:MAG: DUF1549 and DUF1553 domain-containing protein [Planctomycetota bacterium]|nr:DUF1549 and DUF1553 domain-containing protein [Planctomycetota bacterium]MEE2989408.1 DUF1549 and DUF1553 domain-containing protein [Planctomycetota bacterium]